MSNGHRVETERQHEGLRRPEPPKRAPSATDPSALAGRIGNAGVAHLARFGGGLDPSGRVHPDVEAMIARQRGGGSGLDDGARERFGAAYGDPLSDVRVHTGETADVLARSVHARAFTVGSDVFFADGEYAPGSSSGDRLMAHELAHVVQQRGASGGPLVASRPGDALETDADAASQAALTRGPAPPSPGSA